MRSIFTLALMAATAAITSGQTQPRFRADVDLLVVSAIVRDTGNAFVRGLTRDDFELLEDGKPVDIATFAEAGTDARASLDDGRFVVLLMDDLSASPSLTTRMKQIAHGFADRMGPKDVLSVTYLNGGSSVTTQIRGEVKRAIDRFKPIGSHGAMSPSSKEQHAIETIGALSAQLERVGHRRKIVVCIGAAHIFNPVVGDGELRGYTADTLRATARSNVTIYLIDPLGLNKGVSFADFEGGFARETGGSAFANINDYGPAIERVWEESGNYYLLGYEPARRDNRRHSIEVRVKKPDLNVRARRTRG
jgi:VWFA-related protein